MSEPWMMFWIVTVIVSNLLFLGVMIVVAVKGWDDLRDLRRRLRSGVPEPPPSDATKSPSSTN